LVLLISMMPLALPQNTAIAQGGNVTRALPDTVVRGETFNVTVTFITPIKADVISLWDYPPDGWAAEVQAAWCTPAPGTAKITNNTVQVSWWCLLSGCYFPVNTTFTCLYKVTVPVNASPGIHNFSEPEKGYIRHHWPGAQPTENWTEENITGDFQVEVILPRIAVNPSSLAFSAGLRGLPPGNQTLLIWNSRGSGTTLNWTLSDDAGWLGENATTGKSTGVDNKTPVGVSVNITGMSAGDYHANITIADPQASNSPQVVPVTLNISAPEIYVNPSSLAFDAALRGLPPGNQTLLIWNSRGSGSTLSWTLSDDANWLGENATSGSSTGEGDKTPVGVSVNITGMGAGDYHANITIADPLASNSPQRVPVTLHISAPEIYVTPPSLAFDAALRGLPPENQMLVIWNSGGSGSTLSWTLSDDAGWLGENATSGSSTGEGDKTPVGVSVNITGMSAGDYHANITIADPLASNSPQRVPVTLHISAPEIYVTPSSLAFGAVQGGLTPGNQTLVIWNSGGVGTMLSWTLSDDADWLGENATSGNSTAEADKALVGVSVNITGVKAGDYSTNITITDSLASNSPQLVPVTLHINSSSSEGGGGGGGSSNVTIRGDINKDGVVDERDLTLERGIILGLDGVTENDDCNGDGKINALDITTIKRIILGME